MGQIKINNEIFGSDDASDIVYRDTTSVKKAIDDLYKNGGGSQGGGSYSETVLYDYREDNGGVICYDTTTQTLRDDVENYDLLCLEFASSAGDLTSARWNSTNEIMVNVNLLSNGYNPNYILYVSYDTRSSCHYIKGKEFKTTTRNQASTNGLVRMLGIKFDTSGSGGGSYTLPPATSENLGGVIVGSGLSVEQSGKISVNVDAALSETSENPVQNKLITARMNEVFQYVSDGKALIASALTDKGFVISADATFAEFAQCIEDMSRNKTLVQSQTFSTADAAAAHVFSSSWFGSYARYDWKAFDGNNSTQWCCKSTNDMNGEYVGYDFQENIYPLTFEVYINNSNGSNPSFVFQGLNSNDEWVDLTEVTSLTTNGKVTVTKDIDTAISYRKYRLYFLSGVQSTSKGADVYEVRIKGFKYA